MIPLLSVTALAGMAMSLSFMVNAQTPTATTPATTAPVSPSQADVHSDSVIKHHALLGGDGNVTAINGTTITMTEESNEGGAIYTINASGATLTKEGGTAQLSDIKVGDKIFVQGTVDGTNVTATSISLGFHGGHRFEKENGEKNDDMNSSKNAGGKVSDGDGETQDDIQTQ